MYLGCYVMIMLRGSTHLYEDDGVTTEYAKGQFANTSVSYKINSDK